MKIVEEFPALGCGFDGADSRDSLSRNKILRSARLNRRRIKIALAVFYAIAIPAFIIIGLQPSDTSAEVRASESASAEEHLVISKIGLDTPVARVGLVRNTLNAPQYIAGAYHSHDNKILLIGHSATVFGNLHELELGDRIDYEGATYAIVDSETLEKDKISMAYILKDESEPTVILMTCAGEPLSGMDFTHRLILTAKKIS